MGATTAETIKEYILKEYHYLSTLDTDTLLSKRMSKYEKMGCWELIEDE